MAKLKLHNPELAINSVFKNLVIESLTTDPTVSGVQNVGRLWFNTADKTFKGTFLNDLGTDVVVKPIGIDNSAEVAANTAAITQEATDRATADTALQANIDTTNANLATEATARAGADNALQSDISDAMTAISTETTNRTDADTVLQGNIDTTNANLATETTNRTTADTAIQAELDITQAASGLNVDGTYTADATSNYLTAATTLKDADKKLDIQSKTIADNLATETTNRTTADTALDGRITDLEGAVGSNIGDLTTLTTTDKTDLVGAINEVDAHADTNAANIATNVTAISTNASAISTETTNRTSADTALQGNIDTVAASVITETSARTAADTALQGNIDSTNTALATETTNRTSADTTLQGNIDTLTSDVATNYLDKTTLTDQVVAATTTFSQDLVITGDLVVAGVTTTINTETLTIADNIITLNNGIGNVTPTENAGLEVDRGNLGVDVILNWNEGLDQIEVLEDGLLRKVATTNFVDGEVATVNSTITTLAGRVSTNETDIDSNTTAITAEAATRLANDTTLQDNIDATNISLLSETSARTAADTVLQGNIDTTNTALATETTNRTTADTALQGNIDTVTANLSAEATARAGADNALQSDISDAMTAISTETTNRTDADATIQAELDLTQAGAGLGTDGTYSADLLTNYISLATSLKDADKKLDTALNTTDEALAQEVIDRTDADSALDTRVTTVESQVNGNIGDLTTLTTDVKTDLVSALNEVDDHTDTNAANLATEVTNRTDADATIQSELDATQVGAGLGVNGAYTANALNNYTTLATSLTNADDLLDAEIKANADTTNALDTRVTTVETQVNGNIGDLTSLTTDSKTNLVAAINEVDSHIDVEVTNRITADNALQANLDNEIVTRGTSDDALATRIDNVNTATGIVNDNYTADATTNYLTTATSLANADKVLDTTIKTNLDNLAATNATNGTNLVGYEGYTEADTNIVNPTIETVSGSLKETLDTMASLVNTKIHDLENKYVKGEVADADKSDTYTLAHNLDTEFVDVSVQVYDVQEAIWRFDLVVIEVIDANVVKISLASGSAEQIRYVIQGY